MPLRRDKPYIWTTWITKLLSGDNSCEWAAQFKSLHESKSYSKASTGFDSAKWQIEHTDLLNRIRTNLETEGQTIYTENQNYFNLHGKSATLSGKPDLVTINGNNGIIIDAKTGEESASHMIQLLIYMYALPKALPQYGSIKFEGKIIYSNNEVFIPSDAVNNSFTEKLVVLIKRITSETPANKIPSSQECKFCNITSSDCAERIEQDEPPIASSTDDF